MTTLGFVQFCFLLVVAAAAAVVVAAAAAVVVAAAAAADVASDADEADDDDNYAGYRHHENALQVLVGFFFMSSVQFPRRDETLSPFNLSTGNYFLPHPPSCIHASISSCWVRGSFRVQLLPSAPVLI